MTRRKDRERAEKGLIYRSGQLVRKSEFEQATASLLESLVSQFKKLFKREKLTAEEQRNIERRARTKLNQAIRDGTYGSNKERNEGKD